MTHINRRTLLKGAVAAATLPLIGQSGYAADKLKIGFVYLGPIGDHGWTYAHEQGRQDAIVKFGDAIETTIVENVAEGPDSERVIRRLAEEGNQLIFTTSFGYMNPTLKVAKRYKKVKFEHSTGYQRSKMSRPTTPDSMKAEQCVEPLPGICLKKVPRGTLPLSRSRKLSWELMHLP